MTPANPQEQLPIEISVTQAARMQSDPQWTILDCREPEELALARIEGTLHIPMQTIPARLDELPTNHTIAIICHHGVRSLMVAQYLRQQGFQSATSITGGIEQWSQTIDPEIPRY